MSTDKTLSRRGLFMKVGILFNGLVVAALAVPVVRFLLSSVTHGRANRYLAWYRSEPSANSRKERRVSLRFGIRM